jgi:hypothetical protein
MFHASCSFSVFLPTLHAQECERTALSQAAYWGHLEVVQQLLAHPGVDVSIADKVRCRSFAGNSFCRCKIIASVCCKFSF